MSSLKVGQVKNRILEWFGEYVDVSDLRDKDPERETKLLSRCLSALAIYMKADCSKKEAASSVWDGGGDNGVDAAYYCPLHNVVYMVQGKWKKKGVGEPEAKEIGTFVDGAKDVVEQDFTEFRDGLEPKLNYLSTNLSSPGTKICLVVVSTGKSTLASPANHKLQKFIDELNSGDADKIASSDVIGLSEIYDVLAGTRDRKNIDVTATIENWTRIDEPYPAIVGVIGGSVLKSLWNEHGSLILADNIRHSLGDTDVNLEIRRTAESSPEHFWYFNNGITLIANKVVNSVGTKSAKSFTLKDVSIVNGAQTVSTIAKVESEDVLESLKVSLRVIVLESAPDGFGSQVTRTNNHQNRVEARDFVAHDPEQIRLHKEMAMEGVDYQYLRSSESIASTSSCDLMEVTVALSCADGPGLAVQVKTGTNRFFSDLQKAPYKKIFNSNTTGIYAFNAVILLRQVDSWINQQKKEVPRSQRKGAKWGVLVHGNRILAACGYSIINKSKLSCPLSEFKVNLESRDLDKLCHYIYNRMICVVEQNYSNRFLAVLFKNPSDSLAVYNDVVSNYLQNSNY